MGKICSFSGPPHSALVGLRHPSPEALRSRRRRRSGVGPEGSASGYLLHVRHTIRHTTQLFHNRTRPITEKETIVAEERTARRFLEGENAAFRQIFAEHNVRLLAYCTKLVKDRSVAEDMAQETWVRVIGLREKGPAEVRNLYGMIYRIARNLCLDHLKSYRENNRTTIEELGRAHPTTSIRELSTEEEIVLRALDRLPFEYRETIVLHTYSGYSYEEIARMLEKTPEAIWARASRARKRLREIVTEELNKEEASLRLVIGGRERTGREKKG